MERLGTGSPVGGSSQAGDVHPAKRGQLAPKSSFGRNSMVMDKSVVHGSLTNQAKAAADADKSAPVLAKGRDVEDLLPEKPGQTQRSIAELKEYNFMVINQCNERVSQISKEIDSLSQNISPQRISDLESKKATYEQRAAEAKEIVKSLRQDFNPAVVQLDKKERAEVEKQLQDISKRLEKLEKEEAKAQEKIDKLLAKHFNNDQDKIAEFKNVNPDERARMLAGSPKVKETYTELRKEKTAISENLQKANFEHRDLENKLKLADPGRGEKMKMEMRDAFRSFSIPEGSARSVELAAKVNQGLRGGVLGNVASHIFRDAPKITIRHEGNPTAVHTPGPDRSEDTKAILNAVADEAKGEYEAQATSPPKFPPKLPHEPSLKQEDFRNRYNADKTILPGHETKIRTFVQGIYSNLIGKELTKVIGREENKQIVMAAGEMSASEISRTVNRDGSVEMRYKVPIEINDKLAKGNQKVGSGEIEITVKYNPQMQCQSVAVKVTDEKLVNPNPQTR